VRNSFQDEECFSLELFYDSIATKKPSIGMGQQPPLYAFKQWTRFPFCKLCQLRHHSSKYTSQRRKVSNRKVLRLNSDGYSAGHFFTANVDCVNVKLSSSLTRSASQNTDYLERPTCLVIWLDSCFLHG
jgi:hypothetical protein